MSKKFEFVMTAQQPPNEVNKDNIANKIDEH